MRYLNGYLNFVKENLTQPLEMVELIGDVNILESIVTDSDMLLDSIQAKEEDISKVFELNMDGFDTNYTIEDLYTSSEFNRKLKRKNMKKSQIEETDDSETFIENTVNIKFFLIHMQDVSALDKPEYIVFQSKRKIDSKWGEVKLYSVHDDIRKFYDKLTNKTVEIKKDDKVYIYFTSNSGNDWQLQNVDMVDDVFLDMLDRDQIKKLLMINGVKITIIA